MQPQLQPVVQQVLTRELELPNACLAHLVIGVIQLLQTSQLNALKTKS